MVYRIDKVNIGRQVFIVADRLPATFAKTKQRYKTVIALVGPTAAGKTSLGIYLSKQFHGAPILSCDARQCYQRMSIGTAKPTAEERKQAPHLLIDQVPLEKSYNAAQYAEDAREKLAKCFEKHDTVILVGGSGLYFKTLFYGLDEVPPTDLAIREKLNARLKSEGLAPLVEALQKVDPTYCKQADLKNPRRVIRALEVYQLTKKPLSEFLKGGPQENQLPYELITIGLTYPREKLYERIDRRVDEMLQQGLVQEVKNLYPLRHLPALQTIGYQEFFPHLEGAISLEEAVEEMKKNTRNYAKRQLTWFKKMPDITWFTPTDLPAILHHIKLHT